MVPEGFVQTSAGRKQKLAIFSGRTLAYQVQGHEFEPQLWKKKKDKVTKKTKGGKQSTVLLRYDT